MKRVMWLVFLLGLTTMTNAQDKKQFRVWAFGDAHVGTDKRQHRESLDSTYSGPSRIAAVPPASAAETVRQRAPR